MPRTSLVTGGNGFVGCYVARALVNRGDHVRVLVRAGADVRALEGVDCDHVIGDLRDAESVAQAARGCDEIYNVAADYRLWVIDEAPMYATNVQGTRNVLAAARRHQVGRVIHTSTVGALGVPKGASGTEDTPVRLDDMVGPYKRSKFLAEQAALAAAREGVPVVVVNPSTPIGALDYKPTPTGRVIVDFLNGRMPAYLDTGLNLVDVAHCAQGHLLAAERGRLGEKYILGGENLSLRQLFERLAFISGRPAPRLRIPYHVALGFALGADFVSRRITRRPPRASLTEVRMAHKKMFFDHTKAGRELGYDPGSIDTALSDAVNYYRMIGAAPAR
ncbi:MAG TPA: hopanoid-associated sugar epimerase [Candidatus Binataceae bacterium]|jgi:dihydroflavonol-4-reductase|nr:hopanoid-associated sugar epimerase [Candidatus Binataceae bacterium]